MVATEADVRRIALALPETAERPSYGTPGFRVKDRLFARIHQDGDALVVWGAHEAEKESLILSEPAVFFTTPHYDGYPYVLVRLEVVDRDEIGELLEDIWRDRAPKRLVAQHDAP